MPVPKRQDSPWEFQSCYSANADNHICLFLETKHPRNFQRDIKKQEERYVDLLTRGSFGGVCFFQEHQENVLANAVSKTRPTWPLFHSLCFKSDLSTSLLSAPSKLFPFTQFLFSSSISPPNSNNGSVVRAPRCIADGDDSPGRGR